MTYKPLNRLRARFERRMGPGGLDSSRLIRVQDGDSVERRRVEEDVEVCIGGGSTGSPRWGSSSVLVWHGCPIVAADPGTGMLDQALREASIGGTNYPNLKQIESELGVQISELKEDGIMICDFGDRIDWRLRPSRRGDARHTKADASDAGDDGTSIVPCWTTSRGFARPMDAFLTIRWTCVNRRLRPRSLEPTGSII